MGHNLGRTIKKTNRMVFILRTTPILSSNAWNSSFLVRVMVILMVLIVNILPLHPTGVNATAAAFQIPSRSNSRVLLLQEVQQQHQLSVVQQQHKMNQHLHHQRHNPTTTSVCETKHNYYQVSTTTETPTSLWLLLVTSLKRSLIETFASISLCSMVVVVISIVMTTGAVTLLNPEPAFASYSAYTRREQDWQQRLANGDVEIKTAKDLRKQLADIAPMNNANSKIFCPNGPSSAVSPLMENKCGDRVANPSVYGRTQDIVGNSIPGFTAGGGGAYFSSGTSTGSGSTGTSANLAAELRTVDYGFMGVGTK